MSQFSRDWLTHVGAMQLEMGQLLDHFAGRKPPMVRFSPMVWEPAIDLYETDSSFVVTVELAGVKESDLRIVVASDTFTIQGERKRDLEPGRKCVYHQMEIASGPFRRTIKLPGTVDTTKAKASFENGLIVVVLPKSKTRRTQTFIIRGI